LKDAKKAWTVSKDENGYPVYREGKNLLNGIYKTKNGLMK